jgi:glycosyltransferase involved in cell wall biosynthesis
MRLSVIVCTRNRSWAIIDCLKSIERSLAHAAPIDAEIVVVDNGSDDNTFSMISEWATGIAFPVNLQFEARKGLAIARNCGVRAARGSLLVFMDDDCRMSVPYVTDLLRHDANDGVELVLRGGRVELGDSSDLAITIKVDTESKRWNRQMNSARRENLGNCIAGCNMTIRRSSFDLVGLFDERFGAGSPIPSAEDTDFIFRAYLRGITIEYSPDMVVFHYHGRKAKLDGAKIMRNYIIGLGAIYAKYILKAPNLCRPGYWNTKLAIKETLSGQNAYMPELEFSYKKMMLYLLVGAGRYLSSSTTRRLQR